MSWCSDFLFCTEESRGHDNIVISMCEALPPTLTGASFCFAIFLHCSIDMSLELAFCYQQGCFWGRLLTLLAPPYCARGPRAEATLLGAWSFFYLINQWDDRAPICPTNKKPLSWISAMRLSVIPKHKMLKWISTTSSISLKQDPK